MKLWALCAALVLALLATARAARAEPLRILVAASHARGAAGEIALQHAGDDAAHVRDVLTALGGFSKDAATVLVDPTRAQLDAAFDRARALAAGHPEDEVTFLFYFSGHGDKDRIHLGEDAIPMTELADRVRGVPAALRLLVTDACRNYPSRSKGVTAEPGFAMAGEGGSEGKGVVWLFASGEGEPAQESEELAGALFTHYWVSGLRGAADANGDGRVTLAESYDFAYSQTLLRSAKSSGVLQHPSAMFALREAAPIVLTQTFGPGTRLRFPLGADARYLVYALGTRAVVGEIWSRPDRAVALALPPGKYLVQRRAEAGSQAAEVWLAPGQERALAPSDFRSVAEEELAAKGGAVVLRHNELGLELGVGTSRIADVMGLLALRYGLRLDPWVVSIAATGGLGVQNTSAEHVHLSLVGGEATLERRFRLGAPSSPVLDLGAGVAADVLGQTLDRTDAAQVALAGYRTSQTYQALATGPIAVARLRAHVTKVAWVEATLHAAVLFANFDGTVGPLWSVSGGIGAGFDF